jgi:hypothetical protein
MNEYAEDMEADIEDPLRAAKGIARATLLSLPIWACVITVVVLLLT